MTSELPWEANGCSKETSGEGQPYPLIFERTRAGLPIFTLLVTYAIPENPDCGSATGREQDDGPTASPRGCFPQ
jgi:hypothetical protein